MSNAPPSGPDDSLIAQKRSAMTPPVADSRGSDARRVLRILVVDDLVDAAESLAIYLRMLGHTVRTAYDGLAALTAASQFDPHVILLDIGMPKLDGYRVAEQLRQHAQLQSACLIAVSGFGQAADVESARAAGFDHHFIKLSNQPHSCQFSKALPQISTMLLGNDCCHDILSGHRSISII